jgi:AraC-like DNA-binding protein
MKPKLEQLTQRNNNRSFFSYEVSVPSFEFLWHYHPEYELTYIIKGKGKRLVGDVYEKFQEGDFVLIPPLLPHTWVSEKKGKEKCRAIVIQFSLDFIEQLFQFPELTSLRKLFANADRGLQLKISKNHDLPLLLQKIVQGNELVSFTLLLQLLQQLTAKKAAPVVSVHYKPMKGNENQQRINKVFQYVQKEFGEHISLKKAASLIHLSESAFCKFFKRASGKTFSDYTNEIRIAHACQLLIESDTSISEIAYNSGFDSTTYFNRVFLRKKKLRPLEYRKMYVR